MTSLLSSKHWRLLKPCIRVEVYDRDGGHSKPRVRFEIKAAPPVLRKLVSLNVPCVACGASIRVVRPRAENGDARNPASRPWLGSHFYLAVTCPLSVNIGCSRSGSARDEYNRIKLALRPDLASPAKRRRTK